MDNVTIGAVATLAGLGLIALRIQIGVALGIVSFFGIAAILNMKAAWGIVTAVPFNFVGDWNLTAVPMFLLMGYVAFAANLTGGLFKAMRVLLSRLPGGLAVASVGACAMLAAASGSSVATSSAMARIATPEMMRYRYDPGLASGVIASAGTLGSLIPPSILMLLYGYFAEVSIAKLFIAGFIPGILSAAMFAAMIMIRVKITPALAPPVEETFTRAEKLDALAEVWPMPVLIVFVLVGIFAGWFTPTEAGAVGAILSMALALWRRTLTLTVLREATMNTIVGTAGIFMVVIGTVLLSKLMALSGLPNALTGAMLGIGGDTYSVILMVVVLYLILGMFLDSIGILLLTLPIILPITDAVGIDLIWFGIILIKLLEIGLVTPPVGLNVYVMKGRAWQPGLAANGVSGCRVVHPDRHGDALLDRRLSDPVALPAGTDGVGAVPNGQPPTPRRSVRAVGRFVDLCEEVLFEDRRQGGRIFPVNPVQQALPFGVSRHEAVDQRARVVHAELLFADLDRRLFAGAGGKVEDRLLNLWIRRMDGHALGGRLGQHRFGQAEIADHRLGDRLGDSIHQNAPVLWAQPRPIIAVEGILPAMEVKPQRDHVGVLGDIPERPCLQIVAGIRCAVELAFLEPR